MDFNDITFFCPRKEAPVCVIDYNKKDGNWPISLHIGKVGNIPAVALFMHEQELINFKNSLISEFEKYEKIKKSSKWELSASYAAIAAQRKEE